jgi:hypothetical protein
MVRIVSDVLHAGAEHRMKAFGEAADRGVSHEPGRQRGRAGDSDGTRRFETPPEHL